MPKNQWAHTLTNSDGRCFLRRIDACKTEKQVKDAPAVVRWGEPLMLKLAKNAVIWEQEYGFREYSGEEKKMNTWVCALSGFI